jgi:hypothetical protein
MKTRSSLQVAHLSQAPCAPPFARMVSLGFALTLQLSPTLICRPDAYVLCRQCLPLRAASPLPSIATFIAVAFSLSVTMTSRRFTTRDIRVKASSINVTTAAYISTVTMTSGRFTRRDIRVKAECGKTMHFIIDALRNSLESSPASGLNADAPPREVPRIGRPHREGRQLRLRNSFFLVPRTSPPKI